MARVTIEDCLDQEQNRFRLIHLATARAKQLLSGAEPQITGCDNKSVVVALREIADGLVRFKTQEEIEADKLSAQNQETEQMSESDQEKARKALDSLFETFSATSEADDVDDEEEGDDLVYDENENADDKDENEDF